MTEKFFGEMAGEQLFWLNVNELAFIYCTH